MAATPEAAATTAEDTVAHAAITVATTAEAAATKIVATQQAISATKATLATEITDDNDICDGEIIAEVAAAATIGATVADVAQAAKTTDDKSYC